MSAKKIFEAGIWKAGIYAAGIFRGLGVTPPSGVAATGIYRQPSLAKLLLATSATFRALVGAADEAAALAFIATFEATEAALSIPRAIIERGMQARKYSAVGLPFVDDGGEVVMHLEFPIPTAEAVANREDEDAYMMKKVGDLVTELEDRLNLRTKIGGENPLAVRGVAVLSGPDRITADDRQLLNTAPEPNLVAWFVSIYLEL